MDPVLHVDELLHLALQEAGDGDAGPFRNDLGDVLLVDLLLQHLAVALELGQARVLLVQLPLDLDHPSVAKLRRPLELSVAFGAFGLHPGPLELGLERADAVDGLLLLAPVRLHPGGPLLEVGQLPLQLGQPFLRRRVGLLLQGGPFDLQLLDATLHLVDLDGHRIDLDAQPRRGLVDQIDGLVRLEPAGHVAVGEDRRRHQRRVLDADPVVDLVLLLQPSQDGDGVFDARLADVDLLEAALQGGVLLDVLAVLVQRGRPNRPQLPASQHRLQHVSGIDRALRTAGPDDRVELVDEGDDAAVALGDLAKHGLEAILELAPVLRTGHHGPDVQRDDPLVLQRVRDVAGHDALGEPFHDRRLADARLADQHGIVLRPSGQHLDHPADLVVAADHRVELPAPGQLGQVATVPLQRLVLVLGVLVGDGLAAPDILEGDQRGLAGDTGVGQHPRGRVLAAQQAQEDVLRRHVLVRWELLHFLPRAVEQLDGGRGHPRFRRAAVDLGDPVEDLLGAVAKHARRPPELLQQRVDHAVRVGQQRMQDVGGFDQLVVALPGELPRPLERLLRFPCQPVQVHMGSRFSLDVRFASIMSRGAWPSS